uniref:TIR domain-containing protein n=1 Tax=Strongyloides papillosus TaxID=174720 RepID=A0A0N5C1N9_STREA
MEAAFVELAFQYRSNDPLQDGATFALKHRNIFLSQLEALDINKIEKTIVDSLINLPLIKKTNILKSIKKSNSFLSFFEALLWASEKLNLRTHSLSFSLARLFDEINLVKEINVDFENNKNEFDIEYWKRICTKLDENIKISSITKIEKKTLKTPQSQQQQQTSQPQQTPKTTQSPQTTQTPQIQKTPQTPEIPQTPLIEASKQPENNIHDKKKLKENINFYIAKNDNEYNKIIGTLEKNFFILKHLNLMKDMRTPRINTTFVSTKRNSVLKMMGTAHVYSNSVIFMVSDEENFDIIKELLTTGKKNKEFISRDNEFNNALDILESMVINVILVGDEVNCLERKTTRKLIKSFCKDTLKNKEISGYFDEEK